MPPKATDIFAEYDSTSKKLTEPNPAILWDTQKYPSPTTGQIQSQDRVAYAPVPLETQGKAEL